MGKKIICCTIYILWIVCRAFSQEFPDDIYPMKSTLKDVIEKLGREYSSDQNKIIYNLKNENIVITFYKSGCNRVEKRRLNLPENAILEVEIDVKTNTKRFNTIFNLDHFSKYSLIDDRFLYVNSQTGILVLSKKRDLSEFIQNVYYLPANFKIPKCIASSFDKDHSGLVLLSHTGELSIKDDKLVFPPINIGTYFEKDSPIAKNNLLNDLSEKILEHPNSFGYIMISKGENESSSSISKRQKRLLAYLKRKNINCERIIFAEGDITPLAGVFLSVVHKAFVSENQLKSSCN